MSAYDEHSLTGGGIRVAFRFERDRFAHAIEIADGDAWIPLLNSIEGTPDDDWPASPPLQSLHRESRGAKQVALLVGMAGKSHWSASVELDPQQGSLLFDIACRVLGELQERLGSSHVLLHPARLIDDEAIVWTLDRASWRLTCRGDCGAARLSTTPELIRISPCGDSAIARRTVRWGYELVRLSGD